MVQTRYTKRSPMQGSPMHRSSGYHFRVDRGAASAFVVGVALIFAAVRLPTLEVFDFLDETPNKGPAWPRRTREFVVSDQRWQDWSIGERLGDMWHAAEEPVTLVARHGRTRNATIRHVHRDPDVALVQDFLTSSELKAIRKAFSLPFENYDRSIAYGMNISTGVRPVPRRRRDVLFSKARDSARRREGERPVTNKHNALNERVFFYALE